MIAAIVLAAGTSSRMGRPKQTLPVKGAPMLQKVLGTLEESKVDRVVVVLGAHAREVRERVRFKDELVLVNPDFARGMSSSLKLGLGACLEAKAVIIVLGDQPLLSPATVDMLVEANRGASNHIVLPVYKGRRGNPVLLGRSFFPQIMRVRGDVGAKSVVDKNPDSVLEVPVQDEGVVVDIDSLEDYQKHIAGKD